MTVYLTPQQILFIHARLIGATGGAHGVRDLGLLQSATACPRATFDENDRYPALFPKTAALMESLAHNHAFVDGNKRTAITATALFLQQNGYRVTTNSVELERFTLWVVISKPPVKAIAAWFQDHTRPVR